MNFLRQTFSEVEEAAQETLKASQIALTGTLSGIALSSAVRDAVENAEVIDLHTHLLPPEHGELMLWGIDAILTYHYLVSEFFMVAGTSHRAFFALPRSRQADLIWQTLFVERSPLSEATIGVLTVLKRLGLSELVAAAVLEDGSGLGPIRAWFEAQDPRDFAERCFQLSGVRYNVMTNIPFDEREAKCWVRSPSSPIDYVTGEFAEEDVLEQTFDRARFKTALRIDPLLKGDWGLICASLTARGLPETLEGLRKLIRAWAKVMQPEYLMASTPEHFVYGDPDRDVPAQTGWPTVTQLIDEAMVPVAKELGLALALKFGACRGMSKGLEPCGGGDGVCVADTTPLKLMCRKHPTVKFLATFLSRVNQHEVVVLAQKFRNLHVYGCWWYLNNPSMIEEITRMRLEMLGTAFTCQHSDARVIDQLLYKWSHSRRVIAEALLKQYEQLQTTGWCITPEAIQRDVDRLFGGAYEEFLAKSIVDDSSDAGSGSGDGDSQPAATSPHKSDVAAQS